MKPLKYFYMLIGMWFIGAIALAFLNSEADAQIGRKIGSVDYTHSTVGTSAQDAIAAGSIAKGLKGWSICHDGGGANDFLSISNGADPDADGIRIAAGSCYECLECGHKALEDANVKGSAAATGYSVLQFK